jgi:hypothetical protein
MTITELMIAMPTYGGAVKTGCFGSVFGLGVRLAASGIRTPLAMIGDADVVAARNRLATQFFLRKTASHMLFVDSDIEFHVATVLKMMQADEPVIGCVYPQRNDSGGFVIWHDGIGHLDVKGGSADVGGIGMGLCLIAKTALETLVATGKIRIKPNPTTYGFFDQILDGDDLLSEDLSFCRRWRDCGGRVRALLNEDVGHTGEKTYRGRYIDTLKPKAGAL